MHANENQVGGDHYKQGKDFQHWDLIERHGIGYLEGYATKYLVRFGKTDHTMLDLQKARHCVDKLIELAMEINRQPRGHVPIDVLQQFYDANDIGFPALRGAILGLCQRWTVKDLHIVVQCIDALIRQEGSGMQESIISRAMHEDNTGQQRPFGYDPNEEEGR